MGSIGFIGGGNMAEAIIKGILSAKIYERTDVLVSDVSADRLEFLSSEYGIKTFQENETPAGSADILVLSVKPQMMDQVLAGLKGKIKPDGLVISIAAGVKISKIEQALGQIAVIRVMPNTPALISQGACGIFGNERASQMLEKAVEIFSSMGLAVVVETEELIDAVTALSGSGPAYYFLMMEKMIEAGIELGLEADLAKKLVLQTAKGAALLADESPHTPAQLRRKVTSPGGTTEAAINELETGGFGRLMVSAIKKARDRAEELSA